MLSKPSNAVSLTGSTAAPTDADSVVDYAFLRQVVWEQSRNVLDPARDYLFVTRLAKLLRALDLNDLAGLIRALRNKRDAALERAVAEAMTNNETSFFRDVRPFELLRRELLPSLIEARRESRSLRFWSAACSTGQEAYSIAMLIAENFPHLAGWNVRIVGSDISRAVIERSRTGRYHRIEMNRGLPARNIVSFFDRHGEDWIVKPAIRRMCHFRLANLCGTELPFSPAKERFDVIFLRNVMLYLAQDTRRTLLADIHRLLAPDGLLFLGSSEQPADPSIWISAVAGGTCYYRPRHSIVPSGDSVISAGPVDVGNLAAH